MHPGVDFAIRYHRAVAAGATGAELAAFFHEDAVQHELPNALLPGGAVRDLPAILDAAERGRAVVANQHFDIVNALADGDHVALEVGWTGTLAVAVGAWPAGHQLRARIATFLELRDGKIAVQRNYDCYETSVFAEPVE